MQMTENVEFQGMTVGCTSFVDHFWKKIHITYDQEQLMSYKNLIWIECSEKYTFILYGKGTSFLWQKLLGQSLLHMGSNKPEFP